MHGLVQDVRYAWRQLLRSPGFALTAVVSMALGIGATTAIFRVIYSALLHPFPYRDAERIVRPGVRDQAGHFPCRRGSPLPPEEPFRDSG